VPNTTWNPSDKTANLTLTGGNLIGTTTSSADAWIRSVDPQRTGKFYWECTLNTIVGSNTYVGVATRWANLTNSTTVGECWAVKSSNITIDGANSGSGLGTWANGDVLCIAVDLSARLIWFRRGATGNWNGSGTANPATGTGGFSSNYLGGGYDTHPAIHLQSTSDQITANFGDSAFIGAVPSGFTSGWPSGVTTGTNALFTQSAVEHWITVDPPAQVTQVALEQWTVTSSVGVQALVTQIALEMWAPLAVVPPRPRRVQNIQRRTRFT
jgi:hypothetical protein